MSNATPPIVIDGDGDFAVYSTVGEACSSLESDDLEGGYYEAFDTAGHSLRLFADGRFVRMELPEGSVADPEELARRARSYIYKVGADRVGIADPELASIPTMLAAVQSFQFAARSRRRPGPRSLLRPWRSSR